MTGDDDDELRSFRVLVGGEELAVLSIPVNVPELPATLTPAEREVCALVLVGCSNREIARQRNCALRTVANQIASIFRKTGVSSRSELAAHLAPATGAGGPPDGG